MSEPPLPRTFLLLLAACAGPRGEPASPVGPADSDASADTAGETSRPETGDASGGGDDTPGGSPPVVQGVAPWIADTDGGGQRVVITVDTAAGALGASLGGAPLSAFAVDDDRHVSGVPGAHAAGVVDVVVETSAGPSAPGVGLFEYWTPAQIPSVDTYLDAAKGLEDEAGVALWQDQGPHGRRFAQAEPALRPARVEGAFGALPGVRFTPDQWLRLAEPVDLSAAGTSVFAVARWTATTDVSPPPGNPGNVPLTLVGDATNGYGAFGAAGDQVVSNHYVGTPVEVRRGEGLNDGLARLIGATYDVAVTTRLYVGNNQQGDTHHSAPLVGRNTYDTVGAGHPGADGWDGEVGAVVVAAGVLPVADRTKLDQWAQQRWGTPPSAPLDGWTLSALGTMPEAWHPRDGAQLVELASGRILLIGGWSPYDPWGDGDRTTNEVWASDDGGATWALLLSHDPDPPESGEGARFPPGHTVGVTTWQGRAVVLGTDPNSVPYLGEAWVAHDDGLTWERVTTEAPTAGRCLFLAGALGDDLYVMGGQTSLYDATTALADVWRSGDGGATWELLDAPPWSPRGMVYRPVELDGRLHVVGGGAYDAALPAVHDGVYAFDGTTWEEVLPDGHGQFAASAYHALAAAQGRLWLLNGHTGVDNLDRAAYSDDGGASWSALEGGAGGVPSHADAVVGLRDGRVLRISGDLGERTVWQLVPPS